MGEEYLHHPHGKRYIHRVAITLKRVGYQVNLAVLQNGLNYIRPTWAPKKHYVNR